METSGVKNFVSSRGEVVGIEPKNVASALRDGYRPLTPEEDATWRHEQSLQTPGQQIITGLEGAGKTLTFGLSTGIETALGVKPEDIAARERLNPLAHTAGSVVGAVAPMAVPGLGELAVGKTILGTAARGVALGGAYAAGDELHRHFLGDPEQTAQSAVAHIALGALIGGGANLAAGAFTAGLKRGAQLWKSLPTEAGGLEEPLTEGVKSAAITAGGAMVGGHLGHALEAASALPEAIGAGEAMRVFGTRWREVFGTLLQNPRYRELAASMASGDAQAVKNSIAALAEQSSRREGFLWNRVGDIFGLGRAVRQAEPWAASELAGEFTPDNYSERAGRVNSYINDPSSLERDLAPMLMPFAPQVRGATLQAVHRGLVHVSSLLPSNAPVGVLDRGPAPSPGELAPANAALAVLSDPYRVLDHLREGSLRPEHVAALDTTYPLLAQRLRQEVSAGLAEAVANKKDIPYHIRAGLEEFVGSTLDPSRDPATVMKNQISAGAGAQVAQAGGQPVRPGGRKMGVGNRSSTEPSRIQAGLGERGRMA